MPGKHSLISDIQNHVGDSSNKLDHILVTTAVLEVSKLSRYNSGKATPQISHSILTQESSLSMNHTAKRDGTYQPSQKKRAIYSLIHTDFSVQ